MEDLKQALIFSVLSFETQANTTQDIMLDWERMLDIWMVNQYILRPTMTRIQVKNVCGKKVNVFPGRGDRSPFFFIYVRAARQPIGCGACISSHNAPPFS